MKRFLFVFVVGVLAGSLLSAYIAPHAIAWYFEPPVEIGVNCRPAVEWGLQKLQLAQLVSGIIGGVIFSVGFFWFQGRNKNGGSTKIKV